MVARDTERLQSWMRESADAEPPEEPAPTVAPLRR
jgi:hypothetical protein